MSDIHYSSIHGEAARRQFRVSLFMVTVLAFGAFVLGFMSPQKPAPAATVFDQGGAFVGRLVVGE
jgi:hypothetical protein